MSETGDGVARPGLTARGAATKARIVASASQLMYERGVSKTSLNDVRIASATSKSQLYQHFHDKEALIRAVISHRALHVLDYQQQRLQRLDSIHGLERWRDAMVERNALFNGAHGCQLGSLAAELADQDEAARLEVSTYFDAWQGLLADGLARMRDRGILRAEADPEALATGLMAALQGGYLLAQTSRDVKAMEVALDMAISYVRTFATS